MPFVLDCKGGAFVGLEFGGRGLASYNRGLNYTGESHMSPRNKADDVKRNKQEKQTQDKQGDMLAALAAELTPAHKEPERFNESVAMAVVEEADDEATPAPADKKATPKLFLPHLEHVRTPQGLKFFTNAVSNEDYWPQEEVKTELLPQTKRVVFTHAKQAEKLKGFFTAKKLEAVVPEEKAQVTARMAARNKVNCGGVEQLARFSTNELSLVQFPYSLERMGNDADPDNDIISILCELQRSSAHGALIEVTTISPYYADLNRDPLQKRVLSTDFMSLLGLKQRQGKSVDYLEPLKAELDAAQLNLVLVSQNLNLTDWARAKMVRLQAQPSLSNEGHTIAGEGDQVVGQEYVRDQAKDAEPQAQIERIRKSGQRKDNAVPLQMGPYSFINFNGTFNKPLTDAELKVWVRSDPASYTSSTYTLINLKYPYQAIATVQIPNYEVPGLRPEYEKKLESLASCEGTKSHPHSTAAVSAENKAEGAGAFSAETGGAAPQSDAGCAEHQAEDKRSEVKSGGENTGGKAQKGMRLSPLLGQGFTMAIHDEREQLGVWEMYQSRQLRQTQQVDALASNYLRFFMHTTLCRKQEGSFKVAVVGADVGWFALLCARTHESIEVDAFEPNAQKCRMLSYNVALNGLTSQVKVHHAAVGASEGTSAHKVTYVYAFDPEYEKLLVREGKAEPDLTVMFSHNLVEQQEKILGPYLLTCDNVSAYESVAAGAEPSPNMAAQQEHEFKWHQWLKGEAQETTELFTVQHEIASFEAGQASVKQHQVVATPQLIKRQYAAANKARQVPKGEAPLCSDYVQAHDLLQELAFFGAKPFLGQAWWNRSRYGRPTAVMPYQVPCQTLSGFYHESTGPDLVIIDAQGKAPEVLIGIHKLLDAGSRPVIYVRFNIVAAQRQAVQSGTEFSFKVFDELEVLYGYIPVLISKEKGLRLQNEQLRNMACVEASIETARLEKEENLGRINARATGFELMHLFYLPKESFELTKDGIHARS